MNVRRPQEIQHERQEAPAGPKLSTRKLQEASQNELTQKPPGAVGNCREPQGAARSRLGDLGAVRNSPRSGRELSGAARSRRELSGAVRSQPGERSGAGESRQEPPSGAVRSYFWPSLGLGNPARAEILEEDVWGALKIEHYVLRV